jgi:hypothetical protein
VTGYGTSPVAGALVAVRIDVYPGYFTIDLKRNAKSVK